ncbi:MAG: hypothetical protein ACI4NM_11260 [Bullifex sp.]
MQDWVEGSLFDEEELKALCTPVNREKNVSVNRKGKSTSEVQAEDLFAEETNGGNLYIDHIPFLDYRTQSFLLSHGLETVKDLIEFDKNGGHDEILSKGSYIASEILKIISDYESGMLYHDHHLGNKKIRYPEYGIAVKEEKPSPSLLLYGLGMRSLNILFSLGIYTIGQFMGLMRSCMFETIPGLTGYKTSREVMELYRNEIPNWKGMELITEERTEQFVPPSPSAFVPPGSDTSESLLLHLQKSTYSKLEKVSVTTVFALKDFLSRFSINDVPGISRSDIDSIVKVLSSHENGESDSIGQRDKLYQDTENFINENVSGNKRIIYLMREDGATLDYVSKQLCISLERVRQIEAGITKKLLPYTSSILKLETADKMHVGKENIKACFSSEENARIFIKAMKDNPECEYLECAGCFLRRTEPSYRERLDLIAENIVSDSAELSDKIPELEEALREAGMEFIDLSSMLGFLSSKGYRIYNTFVSKRKQKYREIAIKVMEKHFQKGIVLTQLNNVISPDMERLKELMKSEYGYELDLPNRTLHARLTGENDLILIDRSTFIPESLFHAEPEILEMIGNAITSNPSNQIYYRTLFEELRESLIGSGITNHNCLHGVIQHYLGGLCTCSRDYLIKDKSSFVRIPAGRRLEELIRNNGCPMTIKEIKEHFPGFSDVMIGMPISDDPSLLRLKSGKIFTMDLLGLEEEQTEGLKAMILTCMNANHGYTNCYMLHSVLSSSDYASLLEEKELDCPASVFSLARNILGGADYDFQNPHISVKGKNDISSYSAVFNSEMGSSGIITYPAFRSMCERLHFPLIIRDAEFRKLVSDHVRVSKDEYMDKDCFEKLMTGLIPSVTAYVRENMSDGFFSLIDFSSFLFLPDSKLAWNVFLLDSVIAFSGEFDCFRGTVSDRRVVRTIVAEKGRYTSYADLVASFLRKKGINRITDSELRHFLNENRLYSGIVPIEIRNSDIFTLDGDTWFIDSE